MQHSDVAPTERDIRIDVISTIAWRVCDRRVPAGDPRSLFGIVVRTSEMYESVSSLRRGETRQFPSLALATEWLWRDDES